MFFLWNLPQFWFCLKKWSCKFIRTNLCTKIINYEWIRLEFKKQISFSPPSAFFLEDLSNPRIIIFSNIYTTSNVQYEQLLVRFQFNQWGRVIFRKTKSQKDQIEVYYLLDSPLNGLYVKGSSMKITLSKSPIKKREGLQKIKISLEVTPPLRKWC